MDDRGQVSVLVIGMALVAFAVAGLATDATRAFIARRSLQNVADSAALAGSSEIDVGVYYASSGSRVVTEQSKASGTAARWLQKRGFAGPSQIEVHTDGVEVRLRTEVETLFLRLVGITSIPVTVEAVAAPVPGPAP